MSTFKVDSEKVDKSIADLKGLLEECKEAYSVKIPESTVDRGLTHDELNKLCQNIKKTYQSMGDLINNTILFLGGANEMFDVSDKESATVLFASNND